MRGIGTSRKRLKCLIKKYIAILEPFAKEDKLVRLTSMLGFNNFCSNEAMGGKIWLLWQEDIAVDIVDMSDQFITGYFDVANQKLFISFVYAKCNYLERRDLWQSLDAFQCGDKPWMVVGDFNVIREDGERIGVIRD